MLPPNHFDPTLPRCWLPAPGHDRRARFFRCHCPACGPGGRGVFAPIGTRRFQLVDHHTTADDLAWLAEQRRTWVADRVQLAGVERPQAVRRAPARQYAALVRRELHPAAPMTVEEWLALTA